MTVRQSVRKVHSRWLYVVLGMIMFICLGTVYSWSVFRTPFEELYDLNAAQSGLPYLVFLVFYTIFMIVSGRFVDRHNPKAIIAAGGLLVGLGWLMSGVVRNFEAVVFFYGAVSGSGVGIAYGVPIKIVSHSFSEKKGLALGLLLSGFGLSPFITAPIIKSLLSSSGVNHTFIVLGVAFSILIPLIGIFFNRPEGSLVASYERSSYKISSIIKTRRFAGLWSCFVIGATVGLMIIGVTSQIGTELFGLTSQAAALLISVFAVFNALGRPLFGFFTDKLGVSRTASLSFALIFLASLMMLIPKLHSTFLYIVALSIFWMNLGAWLSIAPTAIGIMFDPKNYSRNYGVLFSAYGAGALLGTPIAGFMRTWLGSYRLIFLPVLVLCVLGFVLANTLLKSTK